MYLTTKSFMSRYSVIEFFGGSRLNGKSTHLESYENRHWILNSLIAIEMTDPSNF